VPNFIGMRLNVRSEGQLVIKDGGSELEKITFGMFLYVIFLK